MAEQVRSQRELLARLLSGIQVPTSKDKFAAIGEFVVRFEHVVHHCRTGIAAIFQTRGGLTPPKLAYNITGHSSVTAKPLLDMYLSVLADVCGDKPDLFDVLKWADKKGTKLVQKRNDIVHGTWAFDLHPEFAEVYGLHGHKFNPTWQGLDKTPKELPATIEQLKKLTAEVDDFADVMLALSLMAISDEQVSKYLELKGKDWTARGWREQREENGSRDEPSVNASAAQMPKG